MHFLRRNPVIAGSGRFGSAPAPTNAVTSGLDPRVHHLRTAPFAKKMDCRVKPGNDAELNQSGLQSGDYRRRAAAAIIVPGV
jgi:hypothetical protein